MPSAAMADLNLTGSGGGGGGVNENYDGPAVTRKKVNAKEFRSVVIGKGKPLIVAMCGSLVYYHCAYRNSSIISLLSDVFIVLLCSLAILGLLFHQMNIQVPVDPLEWQISQDTANTFFACLANTVGAAESVLRVAATGHDKRLFLKDLRLPLVLAIALGFGEINSHNYLFDPTKQSTEVVVILYMLSSLGRLISGVTVAYAGVSLFCLYILVENSPLFGTCSSKLSSGRSDSPNDVVDNT